MFLLWLAGVAMRMTILAMPPVIPLVHDELHMSETQVGLLIGLPLAMFAIAAVPGSLLIARIGTQPRGDPRHGDRGARRRRARRRDRMSGRFMPRLIATGFGVAIMQPGMPTLVRDWLPSRIALGTIAYTGGMLMGATFPPALTIPYVLPLVGGSWRLDLVLWAVPALLIAPVFFLLSPKSDDRTAGAKAIGGRWWPDWHNPLIWLLGLTLRQQQQPVTSRPTLFSATISPARARRISSARPWAGSTARRSWRPSFLFCWRIACSGARGRSCCSARCCSRPFW